MIGYDLNGFGQDDPYVRISVQDGTPYALGWNVRTNAVKSISGGDLALAKGAKDSRPFKLDVMIYADSDLQLDSRIGSWYALLDQESLTLGRTVDGVRTVADVTVVSTTDQVDYNPASHTAKTSVIMTMSAVFWRDANATTATVTAGANSLTAFANSSATINDSKLLIAGAATPLTAFSFQDDNSQSGIAWSVQPVPVGQLLASFTTTYPGFPPSGQISAIGVDPANGDVHVSVGNSPAQMLRFDKTGTLLNTISLGSTHEVDSGIVVRAGVVYAADYIGGTVMKFTYGAPGTTPTFTTFPATSGGLPSGIAIDSAGNIYVGDNGPGKVWKYTSSGTLITSWSVGFASVTAIAIDSSDNIYVAIGNNLQVKKFSSTGTLLNTWATPAFISGIAVDAAGNVYELFRTLSLIIKTTNVGAELNRWGSIGAGAGQMNSPQRLATDGLNNVYVTDWQNQRVNKYDGDGVFNGIGAGQWLLYDPKTAVGQIVTSASFTATGDLIGGFSTVPWKGKKLSFRSKPGTDMFGPRTLPVTVTQTGGGTFQVQAKNAFL